MDHESGDLIGQYLSECAPLQFCVRCGRFAGLSL